MPATLRSVSEGDREFLFRLYASTREEELRPVPWPDELKTTFLRQQFEAQTAQYAERYQGGDFSVIEVDGAPAGRLYLFRGATEIRIVDIALLPEFRGRGVGGAFLTEVLEEGRRSGKTVSIHVERLNPALRLYERLGFVVAEDKGVYLLLERRPDQLKTAS